MTGRIRSIKPELLEDQKIAELSDAAFRMFIGMILLADDKGRLRSDARYLAAQVFWGAREGSSNTREEAARAREELANDTNRLIRTYSVNGQEYAIITNFEKHQRIDKPSKPKCPAPPEDSATTAQPRGLDEGSRESREDSTNIRRGLDEGSTRALGGIGSGEDRDRKGEGDRAREASNDPGHYDRWSVMNVLSADSGGNIEATLVGEPERQFHRIVSELATKGWTLEDWRGLARAAKAKALAGQSYPVSMMKLLGPRGDDGTRDGGPLLVCLAEGRAFMRSGGIARHDAKPARAQSQETSADAASIGAAKFEELKAMRAKVAS